MRQWSLVENLSHLTHVIMQ